MGSNKAAVSHPVFGEQQVDGGVGDDVHAELEGLDLSGFSRLWDLAHVHDLVVGWEEELPEGIPAEKNVPHFQSDSNMS